MEMENKNVNEEEKKESVAGGGPVDKKIGMDQSDGLMNNSSKDRAWVKKAVIPIVCAVIASPLAYSVFFGKSEGCTVHNDGTSNGNIACQISMTINNVVQKFAQQSSSSPEHVSASSKEDIRDDARILRSGLLRPMANSSENVKQNLDSLTQVVKFFQEHKDLYPQLYSSYNNQLSVWNDRYAKFKGTDYFGTFRPLGDTLDQANNDLGRVVNGNI
jgi:hypothetical protein